MSALNKHEAARFKICRWCCNKAVKGRAVLLTSGQVRDQYVKYFESIHDADTCRPLVVCVTCKLYLAKASKGSPPKTLPIIFPWPIMRSTRSNDCSFLLKNTDETNACVMCVEAMRFGSRRKAPKIIRHRNAGRPIERSPQKLILACNK